MTRLQGLIKLIERKRRGDLYDLTTPEGQRETSRWSIHFAAPCVPDLPCATSCGLYGIDVDERITNHCSSEYHFIRKE